MKTNDNYYNNPENISQFEIRSKVLSMGIGFNRNKRCELLLNYKTDLITKEEWIRKFTNKN